jgi:hypothetical protein
MHYVEVKSPQGDYFVVQKETERWKIIKKAMTSYGLIFHFILSISHLPDALAR